MHYFLTATMLACLAHADSHGQESARPANRAGLELRLEVNETVPAGAVPNHNVVAQFVNVSSNPIWISLATFERRLGIRVASAAGEVITKFGKGLEFLPAGEGPLPPTSFRDFEAVPPKGFIRRSVSLEHHLLWAGRLALMKPGKYEVSIQWQPHSFAPDPKDIAAINPWKDVLVSNVVKVRVK